MIFVFLSVECGGFTLIDDVRPSVGKSIQRQFHWLYFLAIFQIMYDRMLWRICELTLSGAQFRHLFLLSFPSILFYGFLDRVSCDLGCA